MARPEPGAVPRRPHHISSIAHLFLGEDGSRGLSPEVVDIAVAAPGMSPISAFASAGLALGSHLSATLAEDNHIRWSAGTFLDQEKSRVKIHHDRKESQRKTWTISPDFAAAMSDHREAKSYPTGARGIRWNHLGCLGPAELAHLESLSVGRSLMDLTLNDSGGLVWCLLTNEADRMGPSYILGRLVELIRPERIWILLFPDAWAEAGRPGWLEKITSSDLIPDDPGNLTRCAELVTQVCEDVLLDIHRVRGSNNLAGNFGRNGQRNSIWHQVARGVVEGGS